MIWESFVEYWNQAIERKLTDLICLVDQRFYVFHALETIEDQTQLFASDTTVIEQKAIDNMRV